MWCVVNSSLDGLTQGSAIYSLLLEGVAWKWGSMKNWGAELLGVQASIPFNKLSAGLPLLNTKWQLPTPLMLEDEKLQAQIDNWLIL